MEQDFEEITVIDFKKKKGAKKNENKQKAKIEEKKKELEVDNEKLYKTLLTRIVQTLIKKNPELAEKSKIMLKPPVVVRMGKKTAISNFQEMCKQLNRDYVHVMNFFLLDLGASGSIGDQGFIIKNVLQPKNVESLFRKYITQFVQCHLCKSQHTELNKDDKMRLWFLRCENCNSTRTVQTIKGSKRQKKQDDEKTETTEVSTSKKEATDTSNNEPVQPNQGQKNE